MDESNMIAQLKAWGCDTRGAMERMLDDEDFYYDCLISFQDDEHFARLGAMLAAGNAREAFLSAHALKGVCANLGLTPLYQAVCAAVEPLRAGRLDGVRESYTEILRQDQILKDILAEVHP